MEILGILTTIFGVAMSFGYFTQTYKILKSKNIKGVSLTTYIFFATGITVWLIYGLSIGDLPIIISNIVFLIGALSVIISYLSHRKK